jgi:hypothetical protein
MIRVTQEPGTVALPKGQAKDEESMSHVSRAGCAVAGIPLQSAVGVISLSLSHRTERVRVRAGTVAQHSRTLASKHLRPSVGLRSGRKRIALPSLGAVASGLSAGSASPQTSRRVSEVRYKFDIEHRTPVSNGLWPLKSLRYHGRTPLDAAQTRQTSSRKALRAKDQAFTYPSQPWSGCPYL